MKADNPAMPRPAVEGTAFSVILAVSFCHLLNDMMQSLLPALFPTLKAAYRLSFTQLGWISLAYQVTASLLQPLVGYFSDRRPAPFSLPAGTLFTGTGLVVLSLADSYALLLVGASFLGMGSSVFHPEASRVARMAAGGRHGLAQSLFQLGGNAGAAIGPLLVALVVVQWGQSSVATFVLLTLVSTAVLWNVGVWYKHHGLPRLATARGSKHGPSMVPARHAGRGIAILLLLIFSKFVYIASLTNYYTFYLIERFHVSVVESQVRLFVFLGALALGTLLGGYFGDRVGRKAVIWFSILAALPFTLLLPYVDIFWTGVLSAVVGLLIASAFPAIVVFGQELLPNRIGMVSGLMFGFSFGMAGLGAASLGHLADLYGIDLVYRICSFLPALGLLAAWLPDLPRRESAAIVST